MSERDTIFTAEITTEKQVLILIRNEKIILEYALLSLVYNSPNGTLVSGEM